MPVLEKINTFNVLTGSDGPTAAVMDFPVSVLTNTWKCFVDWARAVKGGGGVEGLARVIAFFRSDG
jgi:hypothetical protein